MVMQKYKKWFFSAVAITVVLSLLLALAMYIIDPFLYYRYPDWYEPFMHPTYVNAGLAKNLDYDTVIVGDSTVYNLNCEQVDEALNCTSIKLCKGGCTPADAQEYLECAIRTGKVKNAIIGIDPTAMVNECGAHSEAYPDYLYDDNSFNDFKYLFSRDAWIYTAVDFACNLLGKTDDTQWFNSRMLMEATSDEEYSKEAALAAYENSTKIKTLSDEQYQYYINNTKSILEEHYISIIRDNPDISFTIFIPPLSVLGWKRYSDMGMLDVMLEMKKLEIETLLQYDNVTLHDFDLATDVICNLDNYQDTLHYSPSVAKSLVSWLKDGTYKIECYDKEKYNTLKDLVLNYEVF